MIKKAIEFARTWKLPVAMICGVVLYVILESVTAALGIPAERETAYDVVTHFMQPTLLFAMLTLSFLKIRPRDLRLHRWHVVLLSVQAVLFIVCALAAMACRESYIGRLAFESAMICFVCPTATASAVIVQKLNGSLSGIVTYIVLCNIMVTVLSPVFLPLVEPQNGMTFLTELIMIMRKVFPLLLCPLFLAFAIRYFAPGLMQILLRIRDMAFYLWLVALALAIMVTVRTIIESSIDSGLLACFAAVSLVCCLIQFWVGRRIGRKFFSTQEAENMKCDDAVRCSEITAAQAFGQKNTIFAIWMALVFLNPLTSVVGGFYSIWHNVINAWQLKKQKESK
ncbi:MAG: transporter [Prevotella sp.]|nr:transporter [Prevotella sp.]